MNYEWEPDDDFLDDICPFGKIPSASREKFGERIKASIIHYLSMKAESNDRAQNEAIENLHGAVKKALEDIENEIKVRTVIWHIKNLPDGALQLVQEGCNDIPSEEKILDQKTKPKALELLFGMTSEGSLIKPGRKRPGGKQSRRFLQTQLKKFNKGKGQPKKIREMLLIGGLMEAYKTATNRKVFIGQHKDKPGPFIEMAEFIYEEISKNTSLKMAGPEHIIRLILERIKEGADE